MDAGKHGVVIEPRGRSLSGSWLSVRRTADDETPDSTVLLTPQEVARYHTLLEMESQGTFDCLKDASPELGALVRNLLLDCQMVGHPRDVSDALVQLSGFTQPGLAAEAGALLDGLGPGLRAGRTSPEPQVIITRTRWSEEDARGYAELFHGGETYAVVDYRDGILCAGDAGVSVARHLGLSPGAVEIRQCVVKAVVAAAIWARDGVAPPWPGWSRPPSKRGWNCGTLLTGREWCWENRRRSYPLLNPT